MKKILFDFQIFELQHFGGISRALAELTQHAGTFFEPAFCGAYAKNQYVTAPFSSALPDWPGLRRWQYWRNRQTALAALRRHKFDVFVPTYYDPYFLAAMPHPFVLIIHDMLPERFSPKEPASRILIENKRCLLSLADAVVTVSAATRDELLALSPELSSEKITVIPWGASLPPSAAAPSPVAGRFLLWVGRRDGYKNFLPALAEVAPLLRSRDLRLVCTGSALSPQETAAAVRLGVLDRIVTLTATNVELSALYRHAEALLFASLGEGFGLPVIEAMAAGCPVVLSDIPVFREVAGAAGCFFAPGVPGALTEALTKFLSEPARRQSLVQAGRERSAAFSWERCAQSYGELFNDLAVKK